MFGDNTRTRTLAGTVPYLSPELFKAYQEMKYKINYNPYKSDVFSLGLVFLYCCTHYKLEQKDRVAMSPEQLENLIKKLRKEIKSRYSEVYNISKLLKLMLKLDENERLDFLALKTLVNEHKYLSNNKKFQDFELDNSELHEIYK